MATTTTGLHGILNDACNDRMIAIDKNWQIIAWNKSAAEISGIPSKEAIGKNLLDVFPGYRTDNEIMHLYEKAFEGIKGFLGAKEDPVNNKTYENHFIPLKDADNKVMGVLVTMHDITHRIKAEQQLQRLNATLSRKYEELEQLTDELSTFTYITSRNIKEPIRQVYSSVELLIRAEGKQLSDGGKANLRRIQSSLTRMDLLLDDILALSRINKSEQENEQVDLNAALSQAMQALENKLSNNQISIQSKVLPTVKGYTDLISHLFHHLLHHVLKSRRTANPLEVRISHHITETGGETAELPENTYTDISFTANIEDEGASTGQDPLQGAEGSQRKNPDPAISLAICRKIMNLHDGYLRTETAPGQGTVYHCCFPTGQAPD